MGYYLAWWSTKRFVNRLYLILDLFSRKVVICEFQEKEETKHVEALVKKAVIHEKIQGAPLVVHSDNGSPMKA